MTTQEQVESRLREAVPWKTARVLAPVVLALIEEGSKPMLSTRQIQDHIAGLTYRPGWQLTVYEGAWEGPHLVITTTVEDAYHPGETTTLDVHTSIPPIPDAAYLDVWLQWRLNRLESHESREWLRRDGRPVFDPHTDAGNRDVLDAS